MNPKAVVATVPGKIIFSGEHAVVHGCLAIATTIDRFVKVKATLQEKGRFSVNVRDPQQQMIFSSTELPKLANQLRQNYQEFCSEKRAIQNVLENPWLLIQFIVAQLHEIAPLLEVGVRLEISSQIPIGCGLGSSAAIILGAIGAITHLISFPINESDMMTLALEAENLQHGYSSGLDLQICYQGGGLRYSRQQLDYFTLPEFPCYLVNTGKPQASTGECVMAVKNHFAAESLKQAFQETAQNMARALEKADFPLLQNAIQDNARLLEQIGVVPARVQAFIRDIETSGGVAKVCGAGSVLGEAAGSVLVIAENSPQELCETYGYDLLSIRTCSRGLSVEVLE